MKVFTQMRIATCGGVLAVLAVVNAATAQAPIAIESRFAEVKGTQGRIVAENVEGIVIKGSGHWLMDEAPEQVVPKLVAFFGR